MKTKDRMKGWMERKREGRKNNLIKKRMSERKEERKEGRTNKQIH